MNVEYVITVDVCQAFKSGKTIFLHTLVKSALLNLSSGETIFFAYIDKECPSPY